MRASVQFLNVGLCAAFLLVLTTNINAQYEIRSLSTAEVESWMKTRIETHKLQREYRANAEKYNSVVEAYFKARDEYLVNNGWDVQEFKDIESAIYDTIGGIDEQESIDEEKEELQSEVDAVNKNEYLTAEQKKEIVAGMYKVFEIRQETVDATKHNWPAVKPYREKIRVLNDWMAGNIPAPPTIE
ncbi:MAG: hypothetical protein RIE52_13500 [Balneola sp.]|jgi:hypothetical protein